jgi:hypothetical protein
MQFKKDEDRLSDRRRLSFAILSKGWQITVVNDAIGVDWKSSTLDSGSDPAVIQTKVSAYLRNHPGTKGILTLDKGIMSGPGFITKREHRYCDQVRCSVSLTGSRCSARPSDVRRRHCLWACNR